MAKKTDSEPKKKRRASAKTAALEEEPRTIDAESNAPPDNESVDGGAHPAFARRRAPRNGEMNEKDVDNSRSSEAAREFAMRESRLDDAANSYFAREKAVNDISRLQAVYEKHHIVEGDIMSIKRLDGDIYYQVKFGNAASVLIPFNQFFVTSPLNYISKYVDDGTEVSKRLLWEEALEKREQFAQKMLGAKIEFMLTHFVKIPERPNEYLVLGSRAEAIKARRKRYFDRGKNGEAAIHEGDTITVDILAVGDHKMRVYGYGVDIQMSKPDVTNRYVASLTNYFAPGDTIKVRIRDIRYDSNGVCKAVAASAAALELEEFSKNLAHVRVGERCIATVTSIGFTDGGGPKYKMFLDALNVVGRARRIMPQSDMTDMHTGDRVIVTVEEIHEDYVLCKINRIAPRRLSV